MSFDQLGLTPETLRAVAEEGYTEPTPIQAQAIPVILQGRDVMALSVGGLLGCLDEMVALAERRGARIYVPTGAIAGLDAVKAAAVAQIDRVTLTTRKPPRGLAGPRRRGALGRDGARGATERQAGAVRCLMATPAGALALVMQLRLLQRGPR